MCGIMQVRKIILFAVVAICILCACSLAEDMSQVGPSNSTVKEILFGVPDVRQSTNYSCGASALQAVLSYWGGEDLREDVLMKKLNITNEGASPEDIIRVAQDMGFEAEFEENITLADLEESIKAGIPVIIVGQAWRDNETTPWDNDWDDGHYMVVIGLDERNVYLEDPSILGSRGYIPRQEFLQRWHDSRSDPTSYTNIRKMIHAGIFIKGKGPAKHALFIHVD